MRRQSHAKAHGLVQAELTVEPGLPAELAVGLFAAPGTYKAWVRYSSSSGTPQADAKADVRGMAVNVLGVEGHKALGKHAPDEQDFLMVNGKGFLVATASDYVEFTQAIASTGSPAQFFLGFPRAARLRGARNLAAMVLQRVRNPLAIQYWSTVPYRFGGAAMKFTARPRKPEGFVWSLPDDPDYMRKALSATLAKETVELDFMVQLQVDPVAMPVEDATVQWSEWRSPFRKVATIRMAPQQPDTDERLALAESMVFSPWHALEAHRPLGPMNRARRIVYEADVRLRHERNGVAEAVPEAAE
ncbi:hypothetical protein SOCE26_018010 [Sorangium cellulosum]|uniref:Catalase n=1 Tax=Sorangium cellulosum TaxID=56 RepID=A0A2L0EM94_SORCE|nr:catalase family protein [Sorangium cellulosum]AUX40400.1 hypothetical protein SOCE26_018010 [Sorangium cellulosum]